MYYLRDRKGKSARIAEKIKKKIGIDVSTKPQENKTDILETKIEKKPALEKSEAENKDKK